MKRIVLVLLICGIQFSIYSQTESKDEKIRTLLELTGSAKLGVQIAKTLIPSFQKAYPDVNLSFWDEVEKDINSDSLINLIIPIYSKYYTEDDIDQLITFYKSPIGKKVTESLPQITQESMLAGQNWGRQIGEQVVLKLQAKGYLERNNK
jgi:hypothetical protein